MIYRFFLRHIPLHHTSIGLHEKDLTELDAEYRDLVELDKAAFGWSTIEPRSGQIQIGEVAQRRIRGIRPMMRQVYRVETARKMKNDSKKSKTSKKSSSDSTAGTAKKSPFPEEGVVADRTNRLGRIHFHKDVEIFHADRWQPADFIRAFPNEGGGQQFLVEPQFPRLDIPVMNERVRIFF